MVLLLPATAWPTWGVLLLPGLPGEVCYCLAYLGKSATAWPTVGGLGGPGLPGEVWVVLAWDLPGAGANIPVRAFCRIADDKRGRDWTVCSRRC